MGVDSDVFEVNRWIIRNFSISCDEGFKKEKFSCRICTVYGAAYAEKNMSSLMSCMNVFWIIRNLLSLGGF
jgi:hypothetical protein